MGDASLPVPGCSTNRFGAYGSSRSGRLTAISVFAGSGLQIRRVQGTPDAGRSCRAGRCPPGVGAGRPGGIGHASSHIRHPRTPSSRFVPRRYCAFHAMAVSVLARLRCHVAVVRHALSDIAAVALTRMSTVSPGGLARVMALGEAASRFRQPTVASTGVVVQPWFSARQLWDVSAAMRFPCRVRPPVLRARGLMVQRGCRRSGCCGDGLMGVRIGQVFCVGQGGVAGGEGG